MIVAALQGTPARETTPTPQPITYPRVYNFPSIEFQHELQLYTGNKPEGVVTVSTTGKGTKARNAQHFIERKKPTLRITSYLPARTLWRYLQKKEAVLLEMKPVGPSTTFYGVLRNFLSINDVVSASLLSLCLFLFLVIPIHKRY